MAKKKNPTDATMRNVRAGTARQTALQARVRKLEADVTILRSRVVTLEKLTQQPGV